VPVIVTEQLKVVRLPVFDAAVNVSVAWIVAPPFKTVFCLFPIITRMFFRCEISFSIAALFALTDCFVPFLNML
jgi:hypothetical protein